MIGDRPRLVLLSFLMLFVELAVIRWSGANVVYLAYFSNLVLLGSFLGIGLGFLWAGRGGRSLFPFAPVVLAAFVAFIRCPPSTSTCAAASSSSSTSRASRARPRGDPPSSS